jgi:hypothetical protein
VALSEALFNAGNDASALGESDLAASLYERSAAIDPSASVYTNWAALLQGKGDVRGALELAKKAAAAKDAGPRETYFTFIPQI